MLGICNGAQILLEAGLVPGTGATRRPTAAFTRNAPEPHFVCRHVYMKLAVPPDALSDHRRTAQKRRLVPAWAAHAEGRFAATREHFEEIVAGGHLAFVYADADGSVDAAADANGRRSVAPAW